MEQIASSVLADTEEIKTFA